MKRTIVIIICALALLVLAGCGGDEKDTTASDGAKVVAINAGDNKIYLDEARYYAYTAQATYETYFITENKELDWDSIMQGETTWQQGVKSIVLDDICQRACFCAMAGEYNVTLSQEDEIEVDKKVKNFFENSNEKLIKKIDISKERLKTVFENEIIAKKVQNIMDTMENNSSAEKYKTWKEGNTVTAEEQWKSITFNEHIFTLKDLESITNM